MLNSHAVDHAETIDIMTVTEVDKAYTAGLIDGEGWIGIQCHRAGTKGSVNDDYAPAVSVTMADREPLDYMCDVWGGKILLKKPHGTNKRAVYYMWYPRRVEMITLLEAIESYLKIKAPQARLILEYLSVRTNTVRASVKCQTPPEEIALRRSYYEQGKALNHRS